MLAVWPLPMGGVSGLPMKTSCCAKGEEPVTNGRSLYLGLITTKPVVDNQAGMWSGIIRPKPQKIAIGVKSDFFENSKKPLLDMHEGV